MITPLTISHSVNHLTFRRKTCHTSNPMLPDLLVTVFYGYLAIGAVFGLYFVTWGAARIDSDAHQLPVLLRFLLWPASVALWPLLGGKVLRANQTVAEHDHEQH